MKSFASALLLLVLFPACSKINSDKNNQDMSALNLSSDSIGNSNLKNMQLSYQIAQAQIRAQQSLKAFSRRQMGKVDAKGNETSVHISRNDILSRHWSTKDPVVDRLEGTRTDKAYAELRLPAPVAPVIVAVLDSGVDVNHEDLQGHIWINQRELNGRPGVDDDGNGYVDDINGWNFLGNSAGINVVHSTMELTREFKRLSQYRYNTSALSPEDTLRRNAIIQQFNEERSFAAGKYQQVLTLLQDYEMALSVLKKAGLTSEELEAVRRLQTTDPLTIRVKNYFISLLESGRTREGLTTWLKEQSLALDYYYNPYFNSSSTVMDDPENLQERNYGNNDVLGNDGEHGTHVSGSIAALRNNAKGIDGQADAVKIMSVRVVPDGDERDKDVANGIRYAVDNGARVINMSFGKSYSPHQSLVDEAMRYAAEHNVLIVHSAGNSSLNLDQPENKSYPVRSMPSWLEVGASASQKNDLMAASFSNYGHNYVDIFSPGVAVPSTVPNNEYAVMGGTSMAAPQIAGIAALILSRYPLLTAVKVKEVILASARKYPDLQVYFPMPRAARQSGSAPSLGFFRDLSITGGVVDAYSALEAAASAVISPLPQPAEIASQ